LLALLDRLPSEDRALLVDEILHRREPDLQHRIRQMIELGIFDVVAAEVEAMAASPASTGCRLSRRSGSACCGSGVPRQQPPRPRLFSCPAQPAALPCHTPPTLAQCR
jgi:hypothetical protein